MNEGSEELLGYHFVVANHLSDRKTRSPVARETPFRLSKQLSSAETGLVAPPSAVLAILWG